MGKLSFLLIMIFTISVFAEEGPATSITSEAKSKTVNVSRHSIGIDYNSWYQSFAVKNATEAVEVQGLIYGMGLNYFYSKYHLTWGWGGEAGYIQALGVAGNSSSTTDYYAKRVSVQVMRLGGRVFYRYNPQLDLGVSTNTLIGSPAWPDNKGYSLRATPGLMGGLFFDTRWRLAHNWELIQALGGYSRSRASAWRFGLTYSF